MPGTLRRAAGRHLGSPGSMANINRIWGKIALRDAVLIFLDPKEQGFLPLTLQELLTHKRESWTLGKPSHSCAYTAARPSQQQKPGAVSALVVEVCSSTKSVGYKHIASKLG